MGEPVSQGHLRRLGRLWVESPLYFITCNVKDRQPLLNSDAAMAVFHEVWDRTEELHGWRVGAYVIMPDHVHFFCAPSRLEATKLSLFIGKWKEWTAKNLHRRYGDVYPAHLWQTEFFDRVLRSEDSYSEKWLYVRNNPVRAGLVARPEDWPYWGTRHVL